MPFVMKSRSKLGCSLIPSWQDVIESDLAALYTCDATGMITYYNALAAELWGRKPEVGDTDERFCGSHMLYRVDGSFLPHDQSPMADVLAGKVRDL
jgi:PAS domain-containing protein